MGNKLEVIASEEEMTEEMERELTNGKGEEGETGNDDCVIIKKKAED